MPHLLVLGDGRLWGELRKRHYSFLPAGYLTVTSWNLEAWCAEHRARDHGLVYMD